MYTYTYVPYTEEGGMMPSGLNETYWMIPVTISKVSLVLFPTFLSSFATDCQTGEW